MKLRPLAGWTVVRAGEIAVDLFEVKAIDDGVDLSLGGRVVNCAVVSWISRMRKRVIVEHNRRDMRAGRVGLVLLCRLGVGQQGLEVSPLCGY